MSQWHMEDLSTLPSVPAAHRNSHSVGYVWAHDPSGSSNHIVYVADDQSVHELYLVKGWGEWGHSNLTTSARAPSALGTTPFGYTWDRDPDGPSQNVLYVGEDGHIHQLYFRAGMSRWAHIDVHKEITPLPATIAEVSTPFAYVWDRDPAGGSSQHIAFHGADSRVHEFYTRGGGWSHNDLNTSSGALHLMDASNTVAGYVWDGDPAGSSQHVIRQCSMVYHVHEFWLNVNDRSWHDNDMTSPIDAPGRFSNSTPVGYSWERDPGGTSQHVIYLGDDKHLHELWFGADRRQWSHGDLTRAAGAPDSWPASPYAYTWDTDPDGSSQNIVYRAWVHPDINPYYAQETEVHVLSFGQSRTWHDINIDNAVQKIDDTEEKDVFGWAWNDNNSAHVTKGLRHYWAT
jgi:hypothetical protein